MLKAFYHIWANNHWREIVLEHFRILQRQHFFGRITIGFIGNTHEAAFIRHMLDAHCLDGEVHTFGPNCDQFEFPTLQLLKSAAANSPENQYLYFHTKGVSNPSDWKTVNWRWYMNTFTLGQLVNLLPRLHTHDLLGAGWGNHFQIGPHFPGNFWLGRGDYLKTLPEIDEQIKIGLEWLKRPEIQRHTFLEIRHAAETWVGQNQPRVFDVGHAADAQIWDFNYWIKNPALQKCIALEGTK